MKIKKPIILEVCVDLGSLRVIPDSTLPAMDRVLSGISKVMMVMAMAMAIFMVMVILMAMAIGDGDGDGCIHGDGDGNGDGNIHSDGDVNGDGDWLWRW